MFLLKTCRNFLIVRKSIFEKNILLDILINALNKILAGCGCFTSFNIGFPKASQLRN